MPDLTEFEKLIDLLIEAGIPYRKLVESDGMQVRIYTDESMTQELDDAAIWLNSTHGSEQGLLETFRLNNYEGYETAEQVFEGWLGMYEVAISK
jgi:hypothetical protein